MTNQERWLSLFDYLPETGELAWKEWPKGARKWEKKWAEIDRQGLPRIAGCKSKHLNRQVIRLKKLLVQRSRIVWEMFNGDIPPGMQVDHKDGDPMNDRRQNLRLVTHSQNAVNRKAISNTGIKGVTRCRNRYVVQVRTANRKFVSRHGCLIEASYMSMAASLYLHGDLSSFLRTPFKEPLQ